MINNVVLVGRLTKDPELQATPNGISYVRFTLAVNRSFTNQQGQREADFIQCVVWRKQAENVARFLKKGSLIGVEGRIETGRYEQGGETRYTTNVVCDSVQFLEPRSANQGQQSGGYRQDSYLNQNNPYGGNQGQSNQPPQQNYGNNNDDPFAGSETVDVSDDDLPF